MSNPLSAAVKHAFQQLFIAGLGWGLIGTVILLIWPASRAEDSTFITVLYYFLVLVLVATIRRSILQHGSYWQQAKTGPASTYWGQLLAIGIFGSLLGALVFQLMLCAGPYLLGIDDWSVFIAEIGNNFNALKIAVLAVISTIATVASVKLLK